jgi:hypothetical protein
MNIKQLTEELEKVLNEGKNPKFVGKEDILFTDEQIEHIKDLFKTACDKHGLTFELNRKEGSGKPYDKGETIEVTVPLNYQGMYRNTDTKATMNLRGSMTFLIWNRIGFTQKGNAADVNFDWDKFKKDADSRDAWEEQQFAMKSFVNMSTRDYKNKQWYGSSIATYDYDDNLAEIGIEKAIDRAMDILSRAQKIKQ